MWGVHGGFFLRKKPLERVLPVYSNSETAITGAGIHLIVGCVAMGTGTGHREALGAIDFFPIWKAVYVDDSDKPKRTRIDNAEG
jgi:hypothetical protein